MEGMMGWGEEHRVVGRSAQMVQRSDLVRKADAMAIAIHEALLLPYFDHPDSSDMEDLLRSALTNYNEVRLLG